MAFLPPIDPPGRLALRDGGEAHQGEGVLTATAAQEIQQSPPSLPLMGFTAGRAAMGRAGGTAQGKKATRPRVEWLGRRAAARGVGWGRFAHAVGTTRAGVGVAS